MWCPTLFGWFPCFPSSLVGSLALMVAYGILLLYGAYSISQAAELLLLVWPPAIIGGLVLPLLNSAPLCALMAESVRTGMGTLVGCTIMLLTITWAGSVIVGRCDLSPHNGEAVDATLTLGWDTLRTGVTTLPELRTGAWIAAASAAFFLVAQVPASLGFHGPVVALTGAVVAAIAAAAYIIFQLSIPKMQRRTFLRRRQIALVRHAVLEAHNVAASEGNILSSAEAGCCSDANRAFLHNVFRLFDRNGDKVLDEAEIKELIRETAVQSPGFVPREIDVQLWLKVTGCTQSGVIPENVFVTATFDWLTENATSSQTLQRGDSKLVLDLNEEGSVLGQPLLRDVDNMLFGSKDNMPHPEDARDGSPLRILIKALLILLYGFCLVALFADPMVVAIGDFAKASNIPPFIVSFVVAPFASNASEVVSSLIFASKKRRPNVSLALGQVYGAITMNNTLCLAVFYFLIYLRGLDWQFPAEVAVICGSCLVVGGIAGNATTFKLWVALVVLLFYPLSIASIALLSNFFNWKYLEEGHYCFLPLNAIDLHVPVGKRIAGLTVPDVRLASLHTEAQVVTYNLCHEQQKAKSASEQSSK
eukprot:SM000145S00809  [mRNA]  locus=s145:243687:248720:+ [translate_table: standard]